MKLPSSEIVFPHVVAGVGVGIYAAGVRWFAFPSVPADIKDLMGNALNVAGVAISFIVTIQGILLALGETKMIATLKAMRKWDLLLSYFSAATRWTAFLLITSAASVMHDWTGPSWWHGYAFLAWLYVAATTLAACYRITRLFNEVLRG